VGKRQKPEKNDLEYQIAFGKKIKEIREGRGWSQIDLAAHSSISESQISSIENGHGSPRLHTIKALAVALGKNPMELFDFNFELKLNTNFTPKVRKGKKLGTTHHIKKLVDENFFKTPKSVKDVVEQCKKKFNINLPSADTSGALLLLVAANVLRKVSSASGKNSYQNYKLVR